MNAESKLSVQMPVGMDAGDFTDRRLWLRRVLMIFVPAVVVLAAVVWYLNGGRYVETDNAYVKTDIAALSPQVSGTVANVLVGENQAVTKGQTILVLDDTNFRLGLANAEAQLQTALTNIQSDKARYAQKEAAIAIMRGNAAFAEREYNRQSQLAANNFVAAAKLDEARHGLESAQQNIALLKQEEAEILARLNGDPNVAPEKLPSYQTALTSKIAAQQFIGWTKIVAPFDGKVVGLPKLGEYARTGVPLLSVISTREAWVEANFKETDLTHMQPNQAVEVSVDTYPGKVFHGHIESITGATGAEFSVLPAQNSSGNWIKVVQRIPVRISIDDPSEGQALRAGMSVVAEVDTGHTRLQRLQ